MPASRSPQIEKLGGKCRLCDGTEQLIIQGWDPEGAKVPWTWANSKRTDVVWRLICSPCWKRPKGPEKHNTARYVDEGCRCDTCREAMANYRYALVRRQGGVPRVSRRRWKYGNTAPGPEERPFWGIPSDIIPAPETGWWTELGKE